MEDITQKKRLIFHFYVPENWRDYEIIKLHLSCLKHYAHVFTDVTFVLALDDVKNHYLAQQFEFVLLDLGFRGNITFKVENNTFLCETKTLYDEVVTQLDKLDGITFFAHSKGIGNEKFKNCDMNKIKSWVLAMYYLSLEDINNVRSSLFGVWGTVYGSLKTTYEEIDNKYHWFYSGTFYWINCQRLDSLIKRKHLEYRHCTDRFFSELWLGDILEFGTDVNRPNVVSSYCESYLLNARNFYDEIDSYIPLLISGNFLNKFYEFKEKMLKNAN